MLAMQRGVRSMGTRLGSLPPGFRRSSSLFLRRLRPFTANMSMTDPLSLSMNRLAPAPARAHHPVSFHGVMHRDLSSAPGAANVQVTFSNSEVSRNVDSDPPADGDEGGDTQQSVRSDQEIEEEILALQSDLRTHHRHAVYDRALATADELLIMCKSHFGSLHPATASAYNNVGLMNKLLGNYEQSRAAYHESLRLYGEVCGKDHASYAAALSNLGMLERGHVIESEANEGEETEDGAAKEEGVDLGQLRDENVGELPKKMSAMERMQLNESAIEYLDEAYRIRISELGENHPHSITSRSQLGSALASAVIAERKQQLNSLIEKELRILKDRRNVSDAKEMEDHVPEAIAKAATKSSSSSNRLSKRRYEAAEDHLRGALNTAVDNPRGESVTPLAYLPSGTSKASSRAGLTLPNLPKKDRSLTKKERRKLGKEQRREKRKAPEKHHATSEMSPVKGIAARVSTLSAATAAQNLAVFKKYHCDWIRLTLGDGSQDMDKQAHDTGCLTEAMEESRNLYEAALHIRSSILPAHHPEVIATKFSLAELLDSPRGPGVNAGKFDEKRANGLREEILEFVQEKDEKSQS